MSPPVALGVAARHENKNEKKGALYLAGGSGACGAGRPPLPRLVLSSLKQAEAEPFMGVRFTGLEVCAELHGEEMDGVLASVALDDLGVYEVRRFFSFLGGVLVFGCSEWKRMFSAVRM